jgi:hypothetical protein
MVGLSVLCAFLASSSAWVEKTSAAEHVVQEKLLWTLT